MKPFLTIGMATHNDFNGVYFTIQALRLSNGPLDEVEFLVVDNAPDTKHGKAVAGIMGRFAPGSAGARYIPMGEVQGTAAPRQRVFDEAQGEAVLCLDSHVLLQPGTIPRLIQWYKSHPESKDLLTGPIVMDPLDSVCTHFSERWRGAMEGTWGLAFICRCGKTIIEPLDVKINDGRIMTKFRLLDSSTPADIIACPHCSSEIGTCGWTDHQQQLSLRGWRPLGMNDNDPEFEIPGQGLGLFTCRKDAWQGFNPNFREFGGEEMYIHRKFRRAWARNLCLPWLRWVHRFGGDWEENKYRRSVYAKARNYVLGHQELGMDLEPIRRHFVDGIDNPLEQDRLKPEQWDHLAQNPIEHIAPKSCGSCGGSKNGDTQPPQGELNQEEKERFLNLMSQAKHITLVVKRRWWETMAKAAQVQVIQSYQPGILPQTVEDTDLLVLHSEHKADATYAELATFAPKSKRILIRSTQTFGEGGEGGGPGMLPAMRRYMDEHREWSVIEHSEKSWGYTVMSCLEEDKPKLPSMLKMAVNLAKALAEHAVDGLGKTPKDSYDARLLRCSWCEKRNDDRCSVCGCFIAVKASMRSQSCPLGRWLPVKEENGNESSVSVSDVR